MPVAVFAASNADSPFDNVRTTGLLDTGATATGIRADIADRLSLRAKGQRRVETANGQIWANEYFFRIGFILGDYRDPGFDADSVHPYVLEADVVGFELQRGFAYPLLIGMDVIGRCDLGVLHDGNAQLVLP